MVIITTFNFGPCREPQRHHQHYSWWLPISVSVPVVSHNTASLYKYLIRSLSLIRNDCELKNTTQQQLHTKNTKNTATASLSWYRFSMTLWSRRKSGVIMHLSEALIIKKASISNMPGNFSCSLTESSSMIAFMIWFEWPSERKFVPTATESPLVRTVWMYWDGMAKTSPGLRVTLRQPPSSLLWHPKNVGLKRKLLEL